MAALLRIGRNRIWQPGWGKPPSPYPKIDWTHPQTKNLFSYWFDTGQGFYIDLVTGDTTQLGTGSTLPNLAASRYGTGFQYDQVGPRVIQGRNNIRLQTFTAPYSMMGSLLQIAAFTAVATGILNPADTALNAPVYIFKSAIPDIRWGVANATQGVIFSTVPAVGSYWCVCATATGATAATAFAFKDGAFIFQQTTAPATTTYAGTNLKMAFNGSGPNDTTVANCGAQIHWAGLWTRALSLEDARQLHLDPYCFLLPQTTTVLGFPLPVTVVVPSDVVGLTASEW